jgi:hypothetical protein
MTYEPSPPSSALYLVDVDNTIFEHGTYTPLPGAVERLRAINKSGARLGLFTARPATWEEMVKISGALPGIHFLYLIHKPWASHYVIIDDKLDLIASATSLENNARQEDSMAAAGDFGRFHEEG